MGCHVLLQRHHLNPTLKTDLSLSLKRMSQVKAEVALNLLKYFRRLVESCKATLVSFYAAQKLCVKDSGQFSISGNDSLCKQTSDEETFVWFPGTGYLLFRVCHLESPCWEGVGQDNVCTVFLCGLECLIAKTTTHTLVCHGAHHILLTQSCSQASLNYLHRCPPSLCL